MPEPSSSVGGTTDGTAQVYRVGYPIRSYYVYEQVYGPDGKMIPNAFVDRNKNGIIDNDDRYLLKKSKSRCHLRIQYMAQLQAV